MSAMTYAKPHEETALHTRMLRLGLAEDESLTYWAHAARGLTPEQTFEAAFQERWFGGRTMARVRYLVLNLQHRFDAFPEALKTLARWMPTDVADRTVICHWHLQLSDPLYREFTSTVFAQRWQRPTPTIDRTAAVRWVEAKMEGRWSPSTSQRMASGLLSAASEAGLCEPLKPIRTLAFPRVSDQALGYLLYLLRDIEFQGSLQDNPYTQSVGLDGELWQQRVRKLPWVGYSRTGNVHDFKWQFDSLQDWANEVLAS